MQKAKVHRTCMKHPVYEYIYARIKLSYYYGVSFRLMGVQLYQPSSGSGLDAKNTAVEVRCADHETPSIRKSWH
jgi:hypothetical protein